MNINRHPPLSIILSIYNIKQIIFLLFNDFLCHHSSIGKSYDLYTWFAF